MKYEMIFGDQSLFEDAEADVIAIRVNDYKKITYYHHNEEDLKSKSMQDLHAIPLIAMRRIIKTPVWTMADKLAGRLPEVGCKAVQIQGFCEVDVLMIHNGCVVVCNSEISDSRPAVLKIDSFMELFTPLETPAEKAQRLRSEWCSKALDSAGILSEMKRYELKRLGEYIGSIHDALLSGELKAPGVE